MGAYKWTAEKKAYWRKTFLLYGLSPQGLSDLRTKLLVAQGFKCGVCGTSLDGGRIAFLDHDHHSGAIRGMLCFTCNRYRVAKNTRDTSLEVVRYLSDPPAHKLLPSLLAEMEEPDGREEC